jgi:DNA polymerase-3 subunit epsilon
VPHRASPDPADDWVAIDFETATRARDSACAVGIAVVRGGAIVHRDAWLIRPPGNEYEYWNIRVHGITPDRTQDAPGFAVLWPHVRPWLDGAHVLAHNASFDMGVLRALLASGDLEAPDMHYVCTVLLARRAFPLLPRHRLDTVCDHCGIELAHHDAASDAAACATVALRCREEIGTPTLHEAVRAAGLRPTRFLGPRG